MTNKTWMSNHSFLSFLFNLKRQYSSSKQLRKTNPWGQSDLVSQAKQRWEWG